MKKLLLIVCALGLTGAVVSTEQNGAKTFELTVDSIMRGPDLVGNPPGNLRWSGDAKEIYFEWRIPKDDQPSTWVAGRDGGSPRRLSEAIQIRQRFRVPPNPAATVASFRRSARKEAAKAAVSYGSANL